METHTLGASYKSNNNNGRSTVYQTTHLGAGELEREGEEALGHGDEGVLELLLGGGVAQVGACGKAQLLRCEHGSNTRILERGLGGGVAQVDAAVVQCGRIKM